MESLKGFLSYTRDDNRCDGGRITKLAEHIANEYFILTGENIDIFVDIKIRWGDDWKEEIEKSLSTTVFFIAVVTPNYIKSASCREEVLFFREKAKQLGNEKLFLPLLYADIPGLDDKDNNDEIIKLIQERNREDWRSMRLKDFDSEEYRGKIYSLTKRLIEANVKIDKKIPEEIDNNKSPESVDDIEEELGTLEKMALYEVAMPEMTETIQKITDEIKIIGQIGKSKTKEINERNPSPSYSQRVEIMKETALEMWPPTRKIKALVNSYTKQLHNVDTGLRIFVGELPIKFKEGNIEKDKVIEYFSQVKGMSKASSESKESLVQMIESFKPLEKLSRDMRLVIRGLILDLTIMVETMEIIDKWRELIDNAEKIMGI